MQGIDKGLAELHGRPLVAHVLAAVAPQVESVMISANRNLAIYRTHAAVIEDASAGHAGPLAGLAAVMTARPAHHVLSVPVDCPAPPPDLAARLWQALAGAQQAACAVAHDGDRAQALFALYRPGQASAANRALRDNGAVWRWQQSIGMIEADFGHCRHAFLNLNTQADLDAFQQSAARD